MEGGRRPNCTPLCLTGGSSERIESGKQEHHAARRHGAAAGGKRSVRGRQRKLQQHALEGPWQPRRGQRAGLNHTDKVTHIAAERV